MRFWSPKTARFLAAIMLHLAVAHAALAQQRADVVLTQTTPLADLGEIERRTRPPVYASGIAAHGQSLDLSKESYVVHVPAQKPPQGYALLVFVPPWDQARLPPEWATVLDEKGVIFISASRSGNNADIRSRRMPLALTAAANMVQKYDVDPARVFIGGFSGGGRVAMRLALAYPDVFRGALLNSGDDPIGSLEIPIPPSDLFRKFQEESQLFYVEGDSEQAAIMSSRNQSIHSMRDWCVFHIDRMVMPLHGHDAATASALDRALTALLGPTAPPQDDLELCRAKVQSRLNARLKAVEDFLAKDDKTAARRALDEVDAEFGGLAAPKSLELNARLH